MSTEIVQQLVENEDYITATVDLYTGRMVKHDGVLYFIAERFGGWEVIEHTNISTIRDIKTIENFMGIVTEIHSSGSRWSCKDLPADVDLKAWLLNDTDLPAQTSDMTSMSESSLETASEAPMVEPAEIDEPEVVEDTPALQQVEPTPSESTLSPSESMPEEDPFASDREDIERLRTMLNQNPHLLGVIRRTAGPDFDPSDDACLAQFVKAYRPMLDRFGTLLSSQRSTPYEGQSETDQSVIVRLKQWFNMQDDPPLTKFIKVAIALWFGQFALAIGFALLTFLGALGSIVWTLIF